MRHDRKFGRLALAALLALSLAAGAACGKKKAPAIAPEVASSDEALYKLGEAAIKKDMDKGLLYLRQLIDAFPKSFYAQRAKLLIADAYFRKGDESNMMLAAAEYREFIRSYPYSPSTAYCQYQVGMTFYKKALKPGRDQTKTLQALEEFKRVVANYPASEQAKAAEEKIKDCERRLAEHNFTIAVQYYNQKAVRAALDRLKEVMATFPDFQRMDELYFYVGDCQFLMRQYDEASPFFLKVVSDFPKSKMVKKAQARLKEIELVKSRTPEKKS
jgi:outer membrane protein assembly factor BamD